MVDDLNLQFRDGEEREKIKKLFMTPPSINEERPTIVFSTPSETGTSYFRLFEPMRAMYKKFSDEANFVYTERLQPEHVDMADCIVMHRCGELHSKYLNVARMWPKTEVRPLVIHDVDDNEFNLPATHPMKELWEQAGKDKMSVHSLKYSDYITTTTPKLKETFNNIVGRIWEDRIKGKVAPDISLSEFSDYVSIWWEQEAKNQNYVMYQYLTTIYSLIDQLEAKGKKVIPFFWQHQDDVYNFKSQLVPLRQYPSIEKLFGNKLFKSFSIDKGNHFGVEGNTRLVEEFLGPQVLETMK